jgi:hypothetical protein
MEAEIRAEIDSGSPVSEPEEKVSASSHVIPGTDDSGSLENRLMAFIKTNPGIRQSELYKEFNATAKTVLQKVLLNLDRSGKVLRVRSGNTYQLSLMG